MDIRDGAIYSEERKAMEKNLSRSKAKYRLLFETTIDGFWWTDKYGHVVEVNEVISEMSGYSQEELIGKHWTEFGDGEWLEIGNKEWENRKYGISYSYEMKMKRKDGAPIWAIVKGGSLLDEDNLYAGTLLIFRNITEKKIAEDELKKVQKKVIDLVSELEKADKNSNLYIRMLSHEIRNPLATISSGIQLLELTDNDEKTLNTIKILKKQTSYLSKLVEDLLDITKIKYKNIVLNKENIDINIILKDSLKNIRPQFDKKHIELREGISTLSMLVNVDPLRITQCIGNVLRNALKFTEEKGEVSVSSTIEGGNAIITIEDNGVGISPEVIDKTFEPFRQDANAVESYNNRGLGIGLSIVQGIIEMHEGDVTVSSQGLGKGSKFTLILPLN